jgi:hypothetical protein
MSSACTALTLGALLDGAELAGGTEHGAQKECGRDAARNLPDDVAGDAAPRKIPSHGEGEGDGGIEMCSAHRAHEVDDGHDHKTGRHYGHTQSDCAAALRWHHARAGRHHDKQECPPSFGKNSPPFDGRIREIGWDRLAQHALLLPLVQRLSALFHVDLHSGMRVSVGQYE